jgi:uncharacterized protein (TIGR02145 family)
MKTKSLFYPVILAGVLLAIAFGCKKEAAKVIPTITVAAVTNIGENSATSGGEVTSDGGSAILSRGVCWSTGHNPTTSNGYTNDGIGSGNFTSTLTGLAPSSTYYVRAYAINSVGTGYGSEVSFKTLEETVTDIDGNHYHKVTINTQVWMVENLNVTHYRNGDPIPNVTSDPTWMTLTTGAYCNYNNDLNNAATYGRLYNWYAVNDSRKIAPAGWHVPSGAEFTTLQLNYGGANVAGGPLKESGTVHWNSPNDGATNSNGFTALPGGRRGVSLGTIYLSGLGLEGDWWQSNTNQYFLMSTFSAMFYQYTAESQTGLSVRLLHD